MPPGMVLDAETVLDGENESQREETMSAPQPPTNGDEPATGADATNGSAPTPAETPQPDPAKTTPAKAAPRKAAPRKPAASTSTTRDTTAVPTVALPATEATEVLATAPAESQLQAEAAPVNELQSPEERAAEEPQSPEQASPVPPGPESTAPQPPLITEPPVAHQAAPPARTITEVFADRLDNEGFFSALFDFTFTRYVTRKLAGPVYVVGLVLIALSTVLALIFWLGQAIATHSFLGAFVFLFGLIITVVGSALAILLLRVAIEVFVAVVAIAENTRPRRKQGP